MQLRPLIFCAALACAVLSSGCAAVMSEVIAAKEQGSEEHRTEGYMLTTSPNTLGVSGALMGVWVRKSSASTTAVTVISKRQIKSALFVSPTESQLQDKFARAVGQLR